MSKSIDRWVRKQKREKRAERRRRVLRLTFESRQRMAEVGAQLMNIEALRAGPLLRCVEHEPKPQPNIFGMLLGRIAG